MIMAQKKQKERIIPEVLVFTDINNGYYDDLAAMPVLAYLAKTKQIELKGIITELGAFETRRRRALYAKGVMSFLNMPFVRVVPGGDYELQNEADENIYPENEFSHEFEVHGSAILRSGMTFMQEYFKSVKDKKIVILLNAPFPDFAKFLNATADVVKKKVKKIVVMGNVLPQKSADGKYMPDINSFNFKFGAPAAETLFEYAQNNDVRLVLVTPESVKSLNMQTEFSDALKNSKNPVVKQLQAAKCESPVSLQYDMLSALVVADAEFKKSGGEFAKADAADKNVFFAKVNDAEAMRNKFCAIYKDMFVPQKITLAQLMKKQGDKSDGGSVS